MSKLFLLFRVVIIFGHSSYAFTTSSYDFIIVGAGTSGSALASELSKENTVLLIEEGGWSSEWKETIEDAVNYFDVLNNPQIEKGYMSIPQTNVNNRIIPLYRAKITGGCGAHYGMCWTLGNKNDFDKRWNIDGWRWNDLSKYWDDIQNAFELNTIKRDIFTEKFIQSAKQNGYEYNPNYNDLNNDNGQFGVSLFQYSAKLKEKQNQIYAQRENSWTQYIEPIISTRTNLDIIVYHRVNKVLFNESSNNYKPTAIGVETTNIVTNRNYNFYATKEVILSAGTFDTPKILLLSGIGDCNEILNEYNISKCILNIPNVGKLLQEHIHFMVESPPLKTNHFLIQNTSLPPFIYATDFRVILFDKNSDFEFLFVVDPRHKVTGHYKMDAKCLNNEHNKKEYKAETIQMFVMPLHLKSRGSVKLKDKNPASLPLIDMNFLSNKDDEELVINSVKKARNLLYADSLIDLYDNVEDERLPGSNIKTDSEILEWSKTVLLTDYHPAGTCKMGVVVDNRLRVVGINNLRIVDASIIPEMVSAHTYAVSVLIGLRASNLILQDHNIDKDKTEL